MSHAMPAITDGHVHSTSCIYDVQTATGHLGWHVTCFLLVQSLLKDSRLLAGSSDGASASRLDDSLMGGADCVPVEVEEDYRRHRRRGYARLLSSSAVAEMSDAIYKLVDELIVDFCRTGSPGDIGHDVVDQIPVRTMAVAMGLPLAEAERMYRQTEKLARETDRSKASALLAQLEDAVSRADAYDVIAGSTRDGSDADWMATGHDMPPWSGARSAALLFLAGTVTTRRFLRACVVRLVECKPFWTQLARTGELDAFVNEVLRFPGQSLVPDPADGLPRYAIEDLQVADVLIRSGEMVILALQAANIDPDVFELPTRFIPHRAPNSHLTFGFGRRSCPGAALARLELAALAKALMERMPGLAIDRVATGGDASRLVVTW